VPCSSKIAPTRRRARVQRERGAELARDREPLLGEIDDRDVVEAAPAQHRERHQADRTRAEDRHLLARGELRALDRVHADAERLGERGAVEREVVGDREQHAARVDLAHDHRGPNAPSSPPLPTVAARERIHHHARARPVTRHLAADALDHRGELVADRRRLGPRPATPPYAM
jgi:hypothetical protein